MIYNCVFETCFLLQRCVFFPKFPKVTNQQPTKSTTNNTQRIYAVCFSPVFAVSLNFQNPPVIPCKVWKEPLNFSEDLLEDSQVDLDPRKAKHVVIHLSSRMRSGGKGLFLCQAGHVVAGCLWLPTALGGIWKGAMCHPHIFDATHTERTMLCIFKAKLLPLDEAKGLLASVLKVPGGPPCRSVSALRHAPGPSAPSSTWQWGRCQQRGQSSFCLAGPKPVRSEEHPFGLPTNSPADQQLVEDDSILWLRVLQQPPTTLFRTFFVFFSPPFGRLDVSGGFPWLCTAELHDTELCGDTSGCRGEAQEGIGYLRVEGWTTMFRKVTCWFGVGQGLWWFSLCVFFFVILLLIVLVDLISFFLVGCWRGWCNDMFINVYITLIYFLV